MGDLPNCLGARPRSSHVPCLGLVFLPSFCLTITCVWAVYLSLVSIWAFCIICCLSRLMYRMHHWYMVTTCDSSSCHVSCQHSSCLHALCILLFLHLQIVLIFFYKILGYILRICWRTTCERSLVSCYMIAMWNDVSSLAVFSSVRNRRFKWFNELGLRVGTQKLGKKYIML